MRPLPLLWLALAIGCAEREAPGLDEVRWLDLTHDFSSERPYTGPQPNPSRWRW